MNRNEQLAPVEPGNTPLVISIVGKVSSGKSTLVNSLLGVELSSVSPIAGWTKEVVLAPFSEGVFIADTPGLKDPFPEIAKKTYDFLGHTDIFVFCVNAGEGVTLDASEALGEISRSGRPVAIALTKMDLVSEEDQKGFKKKCSQQLEANMLPMFPLSSENDEGLQALALWVGDILEDSAHVLRWEKICRLKLPELREVREREAYAAIWRHSLIAGGIGLAPIPGADTGPIIGVQVNLARELGNLYGYRLSLGRIRELFAIVGVATVAREAARALCKLVPILGWLISGAIAFGGTYGLGVALIAWYGSGGRIDKQQLKKIYQREYKAARERFKSDRDLQNKARDSRSEDDDKEDDEQGMYA